MKKSIQKNITETKILTKAIFQGFTIENMANVLNCSKSSVSYKMAKLFKKYQAKNRIDFALKIFSEILDKTKEKLEKEIKKTFYLDKINSEQNTIIVNLIVNRKNENQLNFWLDKAEAFIQKFTY